MRTLTVKEAARRMQCSEQFVRLGLQEKILPIGYAVKNKRWTYLIYEHKLSETVLGGKK